MMGVPGLITRVPDIARTHQLRIIGNGVVPPAGPPPPSGSSSTPPPFRPRLPAACGLPHEPPRARDSAPVRALYRRRRGAGYRRSRPGRHTARESRASHRDEEKGGCR